MEFWGSEIKPGTTVKCEPGVDYILHLSQAALGESKKASDNATLYVKVDGQKLAIGTLSADKYPQIQFDLVFEKEFELWHTSKAASVFFSGYKVLQPTEGDDEMDLDSEEDEDEEEEEMRNLVIKENDVSQGKTKGKEGGKAGAAASKANAVAVEIEKTKINDEDGTDDSDADDDASTEDDSSDEDDSSEDDEESDDEDDEEEDTPKKPEAGKKRVAENALKTPASDKKAKVSTPSDQKTGGKKSTHVATPHPAKQASKTPANNDKSGGSVSCSSCSKTFKNEMALQAHAKAKKH